MSEVTLPFTIAIAVLGIGAAIGRFWMDRVGSRFVATVAGVCYGLGVLLAGFSDGNLFLLYLTYGVIDVWRNWRPGHGARLYRPCGDARQVVS
ncbi:MAG TPA: hypothetical protein VF510_22655 [Ktedonobacterales bacterium]